MGFAVLRTKSALYSLGEFTVIGRDEGCGIRLNARGISRRHAEIFLGQSTTSADASSGEGQAILRDLGSANGTFVNGERVRRGEPQPLSFGDVLHFSALDRTAFRFERNLPKPTALKALGPPLPPTQQTTSGLCGSTVGARQARLGDAGGFPVVTQNGGSGNRRLGAAIARARSLDGLAGDLATPRDEVGSYMSSRLTLPCETVSSSFAALADVAASAILPFAHRIEKDLATICDRIRAVGALEHGACNSVSAYDTTLDNDVVTVGRASGAATQLVQLSDRIFTMCMSASALVHTMVEQRKCGQLPPQPCMGALCFGSAPSHPPQSRSLGQARQGHNCESKGGNLEHFLTECIKLEEAIVVERERLRRSSVGVDNCGDVSFRSGMESKVAEATLQLRQRLGAFCCFAPSGLPPLTRERLDEIDNELARCASEIARRPHADGSFSPAEAKAVLRTLLLVERAMGEAKREEATRQRSWAAVAARAQAPAERAKAARSVALKLRERGARAVDAARRRQGQLWSELEVNVARTPPLAELDVVADLDELGGVGEQTLAAQQVRRRLEALSADIAEFCVGIAKSEEEIAHTSVKMRRFEKRKALLIRLGEEAVAASEAEIIVVNSWPADVIRLETEHEELQWMVFHAEEKRRRERDLKEREMPHAPIIRQGQGTHHASWLHGAPLLDCRDSVPNFVGLLPNEISSERHQESLAENFHDANIHAEDEVTSSIGLKEYHRSNTKMANSSIVPQKVVVDCVDALPKEIYFEGVNERTLQLEHSMTQQKKLQALQHRLSMPRDARRQLERCNRMAQEVTSNYSDTGDGSFGITVATEVAVGPPHIKANTETFVAASEIVEDYSTQSAGPAALGGHEGQVPVALTNDLLFEGGSLQWSVPCDNGLQSQSVGLGRPRGAPVATPPGDLRVARAHPISPPPLGSGDQTSRKAKGCAWPHGPFAAFETEAEQAPKATPVLDTRIGWELGGSIQVTVDLDDFDDG